MNKILKPPCVFCGYDEEDYWELYTHDKGCPLYRLAGQIDRRAALRGIMSDLFRLSKTIESEAVK